MDDLEVESVALDKGFLVPPPRRIGLSMAWGGRDGRSIL